MNLRGFSQKFAILPSPPLPSPTISHKRVVCLTSTDKIQNIEPNVVGICVPKEHLLNQTCIDICITSWQIVGQQKKVALKEITKRQQTKIWKN